MPARSNKVLFRLAPAITLIPAFAAWAVIPIAPGFAIANVDAGLLYVLSLTSMGVYGVILAGWASNSKYAFLGAMRSAAQIVAYEIAMGFALVGRADGGRQPEPRCHRRAPAGRRSCAWNWFWLFPLFMVYFISGVAETNRAPFDVAEGESEIVAGFHVEYSRHGFRAVLPGRIRQHDPDLGADRDVLLRRLAEPVRGLSRRRQPSRRAAAGLALGDGTHWLVLKIFLLLFLFLWLRATFPRYRYDQIMRLGWKVLIPVTLVWIVVEGVLAWYHIGPWRA